MTNEDELCGETKEDGEPCEYSAKYDDGKCGIHTDLSESGGPGRKLAISEEDEEDILEAAREGKSETGCARAAGVDDWHQLDRYLDAHPEFRRAFARARGDGESELIQGGLSDPEVDSSMAKFLLASSFGYQKSEKREVEQETTHSGGLSHTHTHEHELTEKQRQHFNQLIDDDE